MESDPPLSLRPNEDDYPSAQGQEPNVPLAIAWSMDSSIPINKSSHISIPFTIIPEGKESGIFGDGVGPISLSPKYPVYSKTAAGLGSGA